MSRAALEQKIVALAWKDDAFRKAFLADPKGEFDRRLGVKLPPGLKMTAHAEDQNHLHFVIPRNPRGSDAGALSDADLEKVAGGVDAITTAAFSAVTVVSAVGAVTALDAATVTGDDSWTG